MLSPSEKFGLAQLADRNSQTDVVYEPPPPEWLKVRAVQGYLLKAHGKEGFEAAERGGVTVLGD
jgi:hypothetical protein